ncbi:MAG TPA: hypothetical protein VI894_02265 [Candidatus Nanoarchaeia archaeon]|nr:hypothetical protein [Candidatus Nanoarchaeia archaeon]
MFSFFRKKEKEKNEQDIVVPSEVSNVSSSALSKIDKDIKLMQQWVLHISAKSNDLDKSHRLHSELTRKDISSINQWISYLHQHSQDLKDEIMEMQKYFLTVNESNAKIIERISVLENQGQSDHNRNQKNDEKTQITQSNQMITPQLHKQLHVIKNDMTFGDTDDIKMRGEGTQKTQNILFNAGNSVFAGSELKVSEKKILSALVDAQKPLDYNYLSKNTGLNYGTVKNIISSLRKKGIRINDLVNPYGEKEFFISNEMKIELTGR